MTARRSCCFPARDLWRNGAFAYGGLLWSPGGLDHDGFMLKLADVRRLLPLQLRRARRRGGDRRANGQPVAARLALQARAFRAQVLVGPDLEAHRLVARTIPAIGCAAATIGLRLAAEISGTSRRRNTMIAADVLVSTIVDRHSARVAFGWRCDCSDALLYRSRSGSLRLRRLPAIAPRHASHRAPIRRRRMVAAPSAGRAIPTITQPLCALGVSTRR